MITSYNFFANLIENWLKLLGDIVCSKKNKKGKKMYRIKVIIETSAEKLIAAFENSDDITKVRSLLKQRFCVFHNFSLILSADGS
jgi:hypothetical protein